MNQIVDGDDPWSMALSMASGAYLELCALDGLGIAVHSKVKGYVKVKATFKVRDKANKTKSWYKVEVIVK